MNQETIKKVLVAMSGGVDSAVCAYFIQKQGFLTEGVTMRLWSDSETVADSDSPIDDQNCLDAKTVAKQLGIPHRSVAFGDTFRKTVIDRFIDDYAKGLTANPCVECNKSIKFGKLMEFAQSNHFDYLATGHYAKIEKSSDGRYLLKKAADLSKDQSYFLWSVPKENLARILLPLGNYTKAKIREIAAAEQLICAHRSDSQDVCFIPNGNYASFIERHSALRFAKGDFISPDGRILGTHQGIIRYTVGQRKGLGIALGYPAFVGCKNIADNTVTLCSDQELYRDTLTASELNLLIDDPLDHPVRAEAKIRYRHAPAPATVIRTEEDRISVRFDTPQRAIAPGQSVVLYDGDTVIGGGVIEPTRN